MSILFYLCTVLLNSSQRVLFVGRCLNRFVTNNMINGVLQKQKQRKRCQIPLRAQICMDTRLHRHISCDITCGAL